MRLTGGIMKNVIYKIRNILDNHYYIGSTVDSRKRFWEHRKHLRNGTHDCIHLQRAWNKYGEDCFKFEIVEQLNDRSELYPAEQKWLDNHFKQSYFYNVSPNADSPMRNATPEMRAHLSKIAKEWHKKNVHPMQGKKGTQEQNAHLSKVLKGLHAGEKHYRYGKTVSEETRKKIGDTQRGKPKGEGTKVSPEGMAKIRAASEAGHYSHWQGKTHTQESKEKMSKKVICVNDNIIFSSLTKTLEYYQI
jgi:group I intron endonuclease